MNPFLPLIQKSKKIPLIIILAAGLAAGCAAVSDLGKPKNVPSEFLVQRVGLYVHDKAEEFYAHGTGELDTADLTSDLMGFHLEQVLPYNTQTILQEVFKEARMREPGPELRFKGSPLAGYFEVRIRRVRYDYPDTDRPRYRAEAELVAEFKTMNHERVWSGSFLGEGAGFEDSNIRLNRFGRDTSRALEDAFQDALYQIQEEVLKAPVLAAYFRWYNASLARRNRPPALPPAKPQFAPPGQPVRPSESTQPQPQTAPSVPKVSEAPSEPQQNTP